MFEYVSVYKDGKKQDNKSFGYVSNLVFIDAGARAGELFPDENGPGVYFCVNEEKKCLEVRSDLGQHVKWAWMPFPFEVPRENYHQAEFHLFEPNPIFFEELERKAKYASQFNCIVWVHGLAIGDKTEKTKFLLTDGGWGSTICEDKQNENFVDEIEVQKIDFLGFLDFLHKRAEGTPKIDIKMDIEGAEYEVLERMFANWKNYCYGVQNLSVEFHRDFFTEKHDAWIAKCYIFIISAIKNGIKFNWWPGEW